MTAQLTIHAHGSSAYDKRELPGAEAKEPDSIGIAIALWESVSREDVCEPRLLVWQVTRGHAKQNVKSMLIKI